MSTWGLFTPGRIWPPKENKRERNSERCQMFRNIHTHRKMFSDDGKWTEEMRVERKASFFRGGSAYVVCNEGVAG